MERPSSNTLIRYFCGQSEPHEVEPIKLYLSMEMDTEFVESCLKKAWLLDHGQHTAGMPIDAVEMESFRQRFEKKREQLLLPALPDEDDATSQKGRIFSIFAKVAAAILLVGSFSYLLIGNGPNDKYQPTAQLHDIAPGGEKALLTLADGSTISLTEAPKGKLAISTGLQVDKTADGEIIYRADAATKTSNNAHHTISTPNGGQYSVILPDGSKAWLNAGSSLSYPVRFNETARRVKMRGEVYFEIAKQLHGTHKIPFYVETEKQTIQVLGTHFNVNAYHDEPYTTTTLVEGSVKVTSSANGRTVLLHPGEQALLAERLQVERADLEQAMAWREGDFIFKNEDLRGVLRRISRWYDVTIDCPANLGQLKITGMISRNQPLSAVVESLSAIGAGKLSIKERRIVVEE